MKQSVSIIIIALAIFASCTNSSDNVFVGSTWKSKDGKWTLAILSESRVMLNGELGTYQIKGSTLYLGDDDVLHFEITDDALIADNESYTLYRVDQSTADLSDQQEVEDERSYDDIVFEEYDDLRRNPEQYKGKIIELWSLEVFMKLSNGNLWCKLGDYPDQRDVIIAGPEGSSYEDAVQYGGFTRYYEDDHILVANDGKFVGVSPDGYVVIGMSKGKLTASSESNSDEEGNDFGVSDAELEGQAKLDEMLSKYPGDYSILSINKVTPEFFEGRWSKSELRLMRNEIFARHGYIFKSKDLREHFSQQSWYDPRYSDVTDRLSDIEKANIALIKKYE